MSSGEPTITVTGSVQDVSTPDGACFIVTLEAFGDDIGAARVRLFEKYQSFKESVSALGIPSGALSSDVRTSECKHGPDLVGWREARGVARQEIQIGLPLVPSLFREMAKGLHQSEGVTSVRLQLIHQEQDALLRQMYDRMSEEAEKTAQLMASSTGSRLGRLERLGLIESGRDSLMPVEVDMPHDDEEMLIPVEIPVFVSAEYEWSMSE